MTLQINTVKAWKLKELVQRSYSTHKVDAWVYYCALCDEVLLISRRVVEAKGVEAAFDGICPDCGFGLEEVMHCEQTKLPYVRAAYIDPRYPKAASLADLLLRPFEMARPGNARLPTEDQILTTGIENLDRLVHLATRQFTAFQVSSSPRSMAELLSVRAQLDHPIGLNSDTVFIDGGNSFNAYAVSNYAIEHKIEPKLALSRIHISRAFTCFQLASLITERLTNALTRYSSKLTIVSDITEPFQDPEIKDKQEAYHVFQRILRALSEVAEFTGSLVIAIGPNQNIEPFSGALIKTAHTTILTEDDGTFTRSTLARHRYLPSRKFSQRNGCTDQSIEDYLE